MKAVPSPPLEIVYRRLTELIPYAQNARTHSAEQVQEIAASMREFGWTNPVLIDEDDTIIAGHGRVLAAASLAYEAAPTIVLKGLTPVQRRAYVLADNKLALNAGWDVSRLAAELKGIAESDFDLSVVGFSDLELKTLIGPDAPTREGLTADDEVPPATPDQAVSREGDVWLLGRHRLGVGDARSLGDLQRLMGTEAADLVWTDPPYNVAYEGEAGTIDNDDMEDEDFRRFLRAAFANVAEVMRAGAVIYVAHADTERVNFTGAFAQSFKLAQVLIWVKQSAPLSRQDYNWQHEPILYGWKEGAGHYFVGDFSLTRVIDDDINVGKLTKEQAIELLKRYKAVEHSTVIRQDRPTKSELHPTMKPVALVERMVQASSLEGQSVLDPFAGSGTTLIACEKTNRVCRLLELDPHYADVIIKRWQRYTGKTATCSGLAFDAVSAQRTSL